MRQFGFTIRLVAAFAALSGLIVVQGLLNRQIATEAQQQVIRGRFAGDLLSGLLELSASKQRLRAWSLRALIGADHEPGDGEILRAQMQSTIDALQTISLQSRQFDRPDGAPTYDKDGLDEALQLLSDSVTALQPAIEGISDQSDTGDIRAAWAAIETVFDQGAGRDLREVLNSSINRETVQLAIKRADADAALTHLNRVSMAMTLAITVICTAMAFMIARAIRQPLQQMVDGARAYEMGELDHRIPVSRTDELGRFAQSINRMAAELSARRAEEAELRNSLERQVTERTSALEIALSRLRESEGRRLRLLADMSHELRTPTTAIRGEAEIALRGFKDENDYRAALVRISQAASQMGSLIDDLLLLSRGESQSLTLSMASIDITGPLEEALLTATSVANERGVVLSTNFEDSEILVAGDFIRLRQVVALLLDNAIRYSYRGGDVEVVSALHDNNWQLTISDSGIGVDPLSLPHVFDRGFRGANARIHRPDGTGLGLAIAKQLVSAHGGSIILESNGQNGATARLCLPVLLPGHDIPSALMETKT